VIEGMFLTLLKARLAAQNSVRKGPDLLTAWPSAEYTTSWLVGLPDMWKRGSALVP
jgi:hypothetical protein